MPETFMMLESPAIIPDSAFLARRSRQNGGSTQFRKRERLYQGLRKHPLADIPPGEVDQHFQAMPGRYWEQVTKAELIWGLEVVHAFLQDDPGSGMRPKVLADSRHYPERGFTKVMVCSHDQPGLLAKIAAAFSALRVNILRADVYTRADGLALDLFEVNDPNHGHVSNADRIQHLMFLLEGALSEPPRFVSVWAGQFHKTQALVYDRAPSVQFDNDYSAEHTLVRIQTVDRLGLLHDLLQALADSGLNIAQAMVETDNDQACDVFYVTDLRGNKVIKSDALEAIRRGILAAVGS
ncbi:MAG: ACT domain-containing protein [Verrucomicrobiota bacterium]